MIEPGEVQVWRVGLEQVATPEVLDEGERRRAAAFRFEDGRRRYAAAHAGLRRILARYAGVEPGALRFGTGEFGKPYLVGSPFRFSLSHSGELALVAAALGVEVGVDVERIRSDRDLVGIARRFLPAEEAAAIEVEPSSFFRYWTRREAYLKAIGIGIRGLSQPIPAGYFVAEVDAGAGYAGAVVAAGAGYGVAGVFSE